MAPLRRHPRGLEAGDAAAGHHDPPGPRCGADLDELRLAADHGVLDAGDGLALDAAADAGLARARADPDLLDPSRGGLPRHLGIRDERARHRHRVGPALDDDLLGLRGMDHAARHDHRDPHHGLHGRREAVVEAERGVVRGRDVGESLVALGGRAAHRHVVEPPGPGQARGDRLRVLERQPARDHLVAREPGADDQVRPHGRPHGLERLEAEAEAVLQRAAVLVGPPVAHGRQELLREVTAPAGEIHAVVAAGLHVTRRLAEGVDQDVDLGLRERARDAVVRLVGLVRRREERLVGVAAVATPPPVRYLGEAEPAPLVDAVGHRPEVRDDRGVPVLDAARRRHGGARVHRGRAEHHDRAGASPSLLALVGEPALPREAADAEAGGVGRAHDPVASLARPEPERGEQAREGRAPSRYRRFETIRTTPEAQEEPEDDARRATADVDATVEPTRGPRTSRDRAQHRVSRVARAGPAGSRRCACRSGPRPRARPSCTPLERSSAMRFRTASRSGMFSAV